MVIEFHGRPINKMEWLRAFRDWGQGARSHWRTWVIPRAYYV